jgi:phenylacetate-coenzyme A ligase PaaK-like adenylate-forming protein
MEDFLDHEVLLQEDPSDIQTIWSSGTSGQPLELWRGRIDRQQRLRAFMLAGFAHGLPFAAWGTELKRVLFYCTRSGEGTESAEFAFEGDPRLTCTRVPARSADLERGAAPDIVTLSSEGLLSLLERFPALPARLTRVRAFFSTATRVEPDLRSQFEGRFKRPIINLYSAAETGPMAFECPKVPGRFHVLERDFRLESQDFGRGPELLITRLAPGLYPWVRYRIGDLGRVTQCSGECGVRGAVIEGFHGRTRGEKHRQVSL